MNTEPTTAWTPDELGEAAPHVLNGANLEGVAPLVTMQRTGDWKHYQPPASDRPSGAARRRAEHERLKNGITPVEEKAGIPRGRQGVKRGGAE